MNDIITRLRDKNDKAAYEYAKQLGVESYPQIKFTVTFQQRYCWLISNR